MKDETIQNLNDLIDVIQQEGWNVTSVDMDEYTDGLYADGDGDVRGAEVEMTVYIDYSKEDDEFDNEYRIK